MMTPDLVAYGLAHSHFGDTIPGQGAMRIMHMKDIVRGIVHGWDVGVWKRLGYLHEYENQIGRRLTYADGSRVTTGLGALG